MAVTISEKPWSDYTAADYTPEQWHAACLIHRHEGAPTSKSQCKLPVKTPTGTLSRAGVHAAAGALAGARGGVNASAEEKASAARALVRYYGQLGEEPPPSLKHSWVDDFLAHYGVKGMQWGVERGNLGTARLDAGGETNVVKNIPLNRRAAKNPESEKARVTAHSTQEIAKAVQGSIAADPSISQYNDKWASKASGPVTREQVNKYDDGLAKLLTKEANKHTAIGTKAQVYVVSMTDGSSQIHLVVGKSGPFSNRRSNLKGYARGLAAHSDVVALHTDSSEDLDVVIFHATRDENGLITSMTLQGEDMKQTDAVVNFLSHHGIRGMKWGVRRKEGSGGTVSETVGGGSKSGGSEGGSGHVSIDAERHLHTLSKPISQMSDREIKEANARAESIKKYNSTFNDPNAALRQKVDALQLQKSYTQLNHELNPTAVDRAVKFAAVAGKGYSKYADINQKSGGKLNSLIGRAIGIKPKPPTPAEKMLQDISMMKIEKEHSELTTFLRANPITLPTMATGTPAGRHVSHP